MSEEKKVSKSCSGKQKAMFTYGVLQLASTIISAVALSAIALSLCSVKQESKLFNECAEEILSTGFSKSDAVRFCNGG
tara:strand:+ start:1210 stop:1443 length:234 start_codon:yes stop_codon:yes gene_type:complete